MQVAQKKAVGQIWPIGRSLPTPPLDHEQLAVRDWLIIKFFLMLALVIDTYERPKCKTLKEKAREGDHGKDSRCIHHIQQNKPFMFCLGIWREKRVEANSITLESERSEFESQLYYCLAWPQVKNWTCGHICRKWQKNQPVVVKHGRYLLSHLSRKLDIVVPRLIQWLSDITEVTHSFWLLLWYPEPLAFHLHVCHLWLQGAVPALSIASSMVKPGRKEKRKCQLYFLSAAIFYQQANVQPRTLQADAI